MFGYMTLHGLKMTYEPVSLSKEHLTALLIKDGKKIS
jgi:hypothetical protein